MNILRRTTPCFLSSNDVSKYSLENAVHKWMVAWSP